MNALLPGRSPVLPALVLALLVACVASAADPTSAPDVLPDAAAFADPPPPFRPRRILHGLDRFVDRDADGLEGIDRALSRLRDLGVGGLVTSVSFDDYLRSEASWEVYRYGVRKATELGMPLWLYDELQYPSGSAGGIVTRAHPEHAALGLACYTLEAEGPGEIAFDLPFSCQAVEGAFAYPAGEAPGPGNIVDLSGALDEWGRLTWSAPAGAWTVLYVARRVMYEGTFVTAIPHGPARRYINVLDPAAVRAFLRVTHEQYRHHTPPEVWDGLEAIFTDEPLLLSSYVGRLPAERGGDQPVLDEPLFTDRPPAVPWSRGLPERFRALHGYDPAPHLYALFASAAPEACYVRQDFWETVSTLYAEAYSGQIADWCAANGTALSGHVLGEEGLGEHVKFQGSLFAALRPMQIPGVDILVTDPVRIGDRHFIGAKAVSSVAHLAGRRLVQCEGCGIHPLPDGERAGFREYIAQANMLHVMGVNLMTLFLPNEGRIGEEDFRRYCDYTGRLALMLRGGRHVCDVAVLYPVRTAWAWWTPVGGEGEPAPPAERIRARLGRIGEAYVETCRALAQGQVDFDLVDEQGIREAGADGAAMRIGEEAYRVLVLPDAVALDLETLRQIARLAEGGVEILCAGAPPSMASSPQDREEFEALVGKMFGGPDRGVDVDRLCERVRERAGADLVLDEPNPDVFYLHRRRADADVYFIVNNGPEGVTLRPRLRVPGPYEIRRPLTGEAGERVDGELELELAGYEGAFVIAGTGEGR